MRHFFHEVRSFFRKGDLVLLGLCLVLTVFGIMVIASATNVENNPRYILVQTAGMILGVLLYIIVSSVDTEAFSEHRSALVILNTVDSATATTTIRNPNPIKSAIPTLESFFFFLASRFFAPIFMTFIPSCIDSS